MNKKIRQILLKEKDNLEDEILSCLSNLNMLQNFTAEELGMSNETIEADSKKEAEHIANFTFTKQRIEHWLSLVKDTSDDELNTELIFSDLPWVQKQYNNHPFQIKL